MNGQTQRRSIGNPYGQQATEKRRGNAPWSKMKQLIQNENDLGIILAWIGDEFRIMSALPEKVIFGRDQNACFLTSIRILMNQRSLPVGTATFVYTLP